VIRSTVFTVALILAVPVEGMPQSNACATIVPATAIAEIGAFSNMRYTTEHAYGETVLLWRAGNCTFGLLQWSQGLAGDTPIGELQDVIHNPSTGELRFSAKLTVGVTTGSDSATYEPTRDLFKFEGVLGQGRLSGKLIHATQRQPEPPARVIMLPVSPGDADRMRGSATYGAWRERWEPILKVRGPKW
jgi:hypothetical protein